MTKAVDKDGCFLCSPESGLVYASNRSGFALCGLGPIVPGYSLVATHTHVRSAADVEAGEVDHFVEFASLTRKNLAGQYGNCLLTEHGRLPVCVDSSGTTDPHCYHAHFLLFPGVPDVEQRARAYFRQVKIVSSFHEALTTARIGDEYFLLSPDPKRFLIMTRPGKLIRQFARLVVADTLGRPELANWRQYPGHEEALVNSAGLRDLFARRVP
jgi:hypothetical protein